MKMKEGYRTSLFLTRAHAEPFKHASRSTMLVVQCTCMLTLCMSLPLSVSPPLSLHSLSLLVTMSPFPFCFSLPLPCLSDFVSEVDRSFDIGRERKRERHIQTYLSSDPIVLLFVSGIRCGDYLLGRGRWECAHNWKAHSDKFMRSAHPLILLVCGGDLQQEKRLGDRWALGKEHPIILLDLETRLCKVRGFQTALGKLLSYDPVSQQKTVLGVVPRALLKRAYPNISS